MAVPGARMARRLFASMPANVRAFFHLWRWTADTSSLEHLRTATEVLHAEAESPKMSFNRSFRLLNAAQTQMSLAAFSQDAELARDAVAMARRGAAGLRRMRFLGELGLAQLLFMLFWTTGDPEAVQEGVDIWRRVIAGSRLLRPTITFLMAPIVAMTAEFADDAPLFENVITSCREAADRARLRRRKRAEDLTGLAMNLANSFTYSFDVEFMRILTEAQRRDLAGKPGRLARGRTRRRRVRRQVSLALCLHSLSARTGDQAALAESIGLLRSVVAVTPRGHPDAALNLSRLAAALMTEYQATGELAVLKEAVAVRHAAHDAEPKVSNRLLVLSGLAGSLEELANRTDDIGALREAVTTRRAIVATNLEKESGEVGYRCDLAHALYTLAIRTGDDAAAWEACSVARTALDVEPPWHHGRIKALNALGIALTAVHTPDADREAVQAFRDALAAIPDGRVDRAILTNLGTSLYNLARSEGQPLAAEDLAEARSVLARAATAKDAPVADRISTLRALARAEQLAGEHDAAAACIAEAVGLLPFVTPRHLGRADREFRLGGHSGIAEEAAAYALSAGRPEQAVALLEQARGIVMADVMGRNSILDSLRSHAPELADRLELATQRVAQLESASAAAIEPSQLVPPRAGFGSAALAVLTRPEVRKAAEWRRLQERARLIDEERSAAAAEFEDALEAVRARADLAGQLAPPSVDELRAQASDGPVVYVNLAEERCDALILRPDPAEPVQHVALPLLTWAEAARRVPVFRNARDAAVRDSDVRSAFDRDLRPPGARKRDDGKRLLDELGWLWDGVAEPILKALGYTRTPAPGEAWPRIWWCPVGVAVYLPLHAAGHHAEAGAVEPGGEAAAKPEAVAKPEAEAVAKTEAEAVVTPDAEAPRTVLDRAVSTYTSTLGVLAHTRRRPGPTTPPRTLIVAMPSTPDARDLPGVAAEKRVLAGLLPGSTVLEGDAATYDRVRAELARHGIAHFACHGLSDRADSAASRLLLHDHATRPLTVAAVSGLHLPGADLAYLSACSTSDTSPLMTDEALHITSAFQLAGYRHVIGTLWPADDSAAATIAEAVYTHLTDGGTRPPAVADCALALHLAVRALRSQSSTTPAAWASHVHLGV